MRALWRHSLAPLIVAAAVLGSGAPAYSAVAASAAPAAVHFCPNGTHWDDVTHTCV